MRELRLHIPGLLYKRLLAMRLRVAKYFSSSTTRTPNNIFFWKRILVRNGLVNLKQVIFHSSEFLQKLRNAPSAPCGPVLQLYRDPDDVC